VSKPIAVILGASADRSKYGNKSVRAHLRAGYEVLPVNPRGGTIEGLPAYASLDALPTRTVDRISIYLPPAVTLTLLDMISRMEVKEIFLNPGSDSPQVLARGAELGLPLIRACSIVDVSYRPSDFPDE
jgi:hypothetical protein